MPDDGTMGKNKSKADQSEAAYEQAPRKPAPVVEHRELLPTKQADGSLKRQRVQLSAKEIAKRRRQEEGGGKENAKGGKDMRRSLSAGKSKEALDKIAQEVESSAQTIDEKKAELARLSQKLLEAPYRNVKMLRQLHDSATRDSSAVIQRLALLSLVAVLRDILPAYLIRLPTEKELKMQVSADVAALREYEKVLLRSYEDLLATLKKWLAASELRRAAAVRALCALLVKARDFNGRELLIEMLVPVCNWRDEAAREAACGALAELFAEDEQGEATLLAVRQMAEVSRPAGRSNHRRGRPRLPLARRLHRRVPAGRARSSSSLAPTAPPVAPWPGLAQLWV